MPVIENAIDDLIEEYEKAKRYGYVIADFDGFETRSVIAGSSKAMLFVKTNEKDQSI